MVVDYIAIQLGDLLPQLFRKRLSGEELLVFQQFTLMGTQGVHNFVVGNLRQIPFQQVAALAAHHVDKVAGIEHGKEHVPFHKHDGEVPLGNPASIQKNVHVIIHALAGEPPHCAGLVCKLHIHQNISGVLAI